MCSVVKLIVANDASMLSVIMVIVIMVIVIMLIAMCAIVYPRNTQKGKITVPLTSCWTGLD